MMVKHIANFDNISSYEVILEFSNKMAPSMLCDGSSPYVSIKTEIDANALTEEAKQLCEKYGRIPYGSPIYTWESCTSDGQVEIEYIGQTIRQTFQKRFELHSSVMKLLAKYVNNPLIKVYYRVCTRFDIYAIINSKYYKYPLEFFPVNQVQQIVNDIEAYLIYKYKPNFNTCYQKRQRKYLKPFTIKSIEFR